MSGAWGVVTPLTRSLVEFLGRVATAYVQGLPKGSSALCYVQGYEHPAQRRVASNSKEAPMFFFILAGLLQSRAPQSVPPGVTFDFQKVLSDGTRYMKARYSGDTFLVRVSERRIIVDRREKAFKRNTGPEQRERMRVLAELITGCELENEYFNLWKFELEADLDCVAAKVDRNDQVSSEALPE